MTKKSNTILHYEQIIEEKDKRIAELEKALELACEKLAGAIDDCSKCPFGKCELFTCYKSLEQNFIEKAREELAKENNNETIPSKV